MATERESELLMRYGIRTETVTAGRANEMHSVYLQYLYEVFRKWDDEDEEWQRAKEQKEDFLTVDPPPKRKGRPKEYSLAFDCFLYCTVRDSMADYNCCFTLACEMVSEWLAECFPDPASGASHRKIIARGYRRHYKRLKSAYKKYANY